MEAIFSSTAMTNRDITVYISGYQAGVSDKSKGVR